MPQELQVKGNTTPGEEKPEELDERYFFITADPLRRSDFAATL